MLTSATAVKSGYEDMKRVNLELASVKRLEKLDDEVKLLWLMAKYSVVAVLKVLVALNTVPASLTEHQRHKYLLRMANADQTIEGDLEVIYTFLSKSCSSDALGRMHLQFKRKDWYWDPQLWSALVAVSHLFRTLRHQ